MIYFRIFNGEGDLAVNKSEKNLPDSAREELEVFKALFASSSSVNGVSVNRRAKIVQAVASLVDYTFDYYDIWMLVRKAENLGLDVTSPPVRPTLKNRK